MNQLCAFLVVIGLSIVLALIFSGFFFTKEIKAVDLSSSDDELIKILKGGNISLSQGNLIVAELLDRLIKTHKKL